MTFYQIHGNRIVQIYKPCRLNKKVQHIFQEVETYIVRNCINYSMIYWACTKYVGLTVIAEKSLIHGIWNINIWHGRNTECGYECRDGVRNRSTKVEACIKSVSLSSTIVLTRLRLFHHAGKGGLEKHFLDEFRSPTPYSALRIFYNAQILIFKLKLIYV